MPWENGRTVPDNFNQQDLFTGHLNWQLPRGSRITVGVTTTLQRVLFGPTSRNDGSENLIGALRTAMGMCGARTVREFQEAEE